MSVEFWCKFGVGDMIQEIIGKQLFKVTEGDEYIQEK